MSDQPPYGWGQAEPQSPAPPPPPPAPGYGSTYGYGPGYTPAPYMQPKRTNGKAVAAMVLGIAGFVSGCFFTHIPAVILGHQARAEIDRSNGTLDGRGMATAGVILGWIGIGLVALASVILIIVWIAIASTT